MIWIRINQSAVPHYRSYLEARYGDIQSLNRKYGSAFAAFSDIPLMSDPLPAGLPATDWAAFIAGWEDPDTGLLHKPPTASLSIDGLDYRFRNYLEERFTTPQAVSSFLGYPINSFSELSPPLQLADYQKFISSKPQLRREFLLRNYATVLDYMLLHGRGVFNTFVYCTLAVIAALLVNPLAAYAMSRYRLPKTYTLLLFMLLTMAFPPMVTQIPVFLMLRDLNMLNTFAALILPGLAHGYSIFLLKGFFDSLPRELYESAEIDGAGEWRMFWQITMALSKPILAVIALQAFNIAYANFMFALLICQDQQMWTLMVWLYQLQSQSGQGVIYSSLLIAAIPTFIIFIFCQKIIMRGIVVPVEK